MFTFILAVMIIPTQVTALGFLQLLGKIGLDDSFVPLIVPSIAAPVTARLTTLGSDPNVFLDSGGGSGITEPRLHITLP